VSEQLKATRPRRAQDIGTWELEADVVVVGLGCAGASAALEASSLGADTLVLERASAGGGTSTLSGGVIYLGGGTPVQKACGFDDSPDEMFRFLAYASGPDADEAKIRLLCDESVAHYHWLVDQGVPFKHSFYPEEPSMESPTDDCLVFTGGEDTWPYNTIATPVPRGHKPQYPGRAGTFFMDCLLEAVERSPTRVECDVRARTLVLDDEGRVVGLVATRAGRELRVRARRGVVLSAGGFVLNEAMVARHSPALAQCSWKLSAGHDDGSGILMGQGAGAATIHMDAGECAIPLTPPRRLVRGVMVNRWGQRFINEDAYYGRIGQASIFRQDGEFYWIHDNDTYELNDSDMQVKWAGDTIEELEREIGLPEGSLQATIELYNRHATQGRDPVFHKGREFLKPLNAPPFGAIDCRTTETLYATFTLMTPDGDAIPGLYAAGRTTSGIAAFGYSSGISLADGTFFGRVAARAAVGG
jgi:succinate dehydrogenase/fumarate reductase flavoprotein subunit